MSFFNSSSDQSCAEDELEGLKTTADIQDAIAEVDAQIKAVAEEKDDYEWKRFDCAAAARRAHYSTKIGQCEASLETLRASRAELELELAEVQKEDAERRRAAQRLRDKQNASLVPSSNDGRIASETLKPDNQAGSPRSEPNQGDFDSMRSIGTEGNPEISMRSIPW